ncbi:MAG: ribosome biogenesis GTPase [Cellvibrionaceae bacterium]
MFLKNNFYCKYFNLYSGKLDFMQKGLVIKSISGFYTVRTDSGEDFVCKLPGKLKRERSLTDIVALGDRVTFTYNPNEENGLIETVKERVNALSRSRPSAHNRSWKTDKEQVLVANVDQVVFVFSLKKPTTSLRKLDRLLVGTEQQNIPAVICVNKIDLGTIEEGKVQFGLYKKIGYDVVYTSTTSNEGVQELRDLLKDRVSVFAGSSGVGKSSLLNAIQPKLGLRTNNVSDATGKGLHTTRYGELFPLNFGGWVADTPGIRGWALYDIEPKELDAYFREIEPFVSQCQFSDCSHNNDPGCAVQQAVADGHISAERFDSYHRLREEHENLLEEPW